MRTLQGEILRQVPQCESFTDTYGREVQWDHCEDFHIRLTDTRRSSQPRRFQAAELGEIRGVIIDLSETDFGWVTEVVLRVYKLLEAA